MTKLVHQTKLFGKVRQTCIMHFAFDGVVMPTQTPGGWWPFVEYRKKTPRENPEEREAEATTNGPLVLENAMTD
eukprot:3164551-Amphidinium_carterae.1